MLNSTRIAPRDGARRGASRLRVRAAERRGLSLLEILISMFVLLFGLMGVATMFPVGSHYAVRGEQFDRAAAVAQAAFDEIRTRGMLYPESWYYGGVVGTPVINSQTTDPTLLNHFQMQDSGHAFVIDPLGIGQAQNFTEPSDASIFPAATAAFNGNPWSNPGNGQRWGAIWPIRRVSFPGIDPASGNLGLLDSAAAETVFRLRDDLAVELPDQADRPGIARWEVYRGRPMARAYVGAYSWLATVVPATSRALEAIQPALSDHGQWLYDVSIVVFHQRDAVPSDASERLVQAEYYPGGEVHLYLPDGSQPGPLDAALDGMRAGNWIALAGVHPTSGVFLLKWYRLLTLDDESESNTLPDQNTSGMFIRRATVDGPEWPFQQGFIGATNLRAVVLPGVIGVTTRPMRMQRDIGG